MMSVVLGIDPGSRVTGFGVIRINGNRTQFIDCGCVRTEKATTTADKLALIFQGVSGIIAEYQPDQMAIEQVFMARNADSALKLGQARGVAMVAGAQQQLAVHEYSARQIKQAVVGTGAATKQQMQTMVVKLLGLSAEPAADAADALGVALCHAHMSGGLMRLATEAKWRRGRARSLL